MLISIASSDNYLAMVETDGKGVTVRQAAWSPSGLSNLGRSDQVSPENVPRSMDSDS